jgi:hypothetical protein
MKITGKDIATLAFLFFTLKGIGWLLLILLPSYYLF